MVELKNDDCINVMKAMKDLSVDLTLTDIPYNEASRVSNGLRRLDYGKADIMTFELHNFLQEVMRVTKGTIIIFCGKGQFSEIHKFFNEQQKANKGTVRQLVWEKTNPCPMNGQYIYLSGIENAVWFKKRGAVFNARCKNTVFRAPLGTGKKHPTEKNHKLLQELIRDNSNENGLIFDPCMGSGSTGVVALENNRNFFGVELDEEYFSIAKKSIENVEKTLIT